MVLNSKQPPVELERKSIIDFLFSSSKVPENYELFFDALTGKSLTWAQLKNEVLRFSAGLQEKFNFKKGDVVSIFSPNQYDYIVPLLGAVAAGGAASPSNPAYTPTELAYQVEATKAKVMIAHVSNIDIAVKAAEMVGLPKSSILIFGNETVNDIRTFRQALFSDKPGSPVKLTSEESETHVAYLCFSSGTTGKSKGVMTTHFNIISNILQFHMLDKDFINERDRIIGVLPFYHIYGLVLVLHCSIYFGTQVYVLPRFHLETLCQTIQNNKITLAYLVPPILLQLAKNPIIQNYDLSSLREIMSGAAPLGDELSKQLMARLPNAILRQSYGLTETSPAAVIEPTHDVVLGSSGFLLSNMSAKIVDEEGKEVKPGERGELWLKGPNIMKGYLNNPEATMGCIDADAYFHTGDVAVIDENERFYIVDRIKELIKYKGFQVPPAELEAIILKSPIVSDCAVIGVYDKNQVTELPRAYIVLKEGVSKSVESENEIKKFVSDQVVHYKRLRSVVFIEEIPKSPSGKILRRLLRDSAAKEQEENIEVKAKL